MVLTNAGPGEIHATVRVVEGSCFCINTVYVIALVKTSFFDVFLHKSRPQLFGELSEVAVAGNFQCLGECHIAVGGNIGNLISVTVIHTSGAVDMEAVGVIEIFD